jgi:hypothetical protein
MRDWKEFVQERLGFLGLDGAEAEEVAGELAGHLEEQYEALLANGGEEQEAFVETGNLAGDWEKLRRGIVSAKQEELMKDRVRQIWLPSLITLFTSWTLLALLMWAGTRPVVWHGGEPRSAVFYVPWLLLLPLIGAFGGYLSRRSQGSGWRLYVSGAFPALAIAVIFAVTFPFAFVVDRQVAPDFKFASQLANTISWVIVPGIALCLGVALQNLRKAQGRSR